MKHKFNLLLVVVGIAAIALSLTYRYQASSPTTNDVAALQEPLAESGARSPAESSGETYPAELLDAAQSADIEAMFDDTPLPDADDDLLIIEQGDATRYNSEQDRLDGLERQQSARDASLQASAYVGDDRMQVIGVLGAYAGDGNADAAAELRRVLQSQDADLRADALEAIGELLPESHAVPPFSDEPLTDGEVDILIETLKARKPM